MSRKDRVQELIKQEIADVLIKKMGDKRIGMVTVTGVKISSDFHHAKVYYSQIGDERQRKKTNKALNAAAGYVQYQLGRTIRLKSIPTLTFIYDDSLEKGVNLVKQIDETVE